MPESDDSTDGDTLSMKIIFLDFDGVLNYEGPDPGNRINRADMADDPSIALFWEKCQLVQCIVNQTGAAIVLSTAWRHDFSQSVIEGWLAEKGLTAPIVGITPSYLPPWRIHEIREYLQDHPDISRYIVLDDLDLREGKFNLFIRCDPTKGLTEEQVQEAIAYLNEEET